MLHRCRRRHSQSVLNCQFKFIGSRSPASWSSSIASGVSEWVRVFSLRKPANRYTRTHTHAHTHTDNRCPSTGICENLFLVFLDSNRLRVACLVAKQMFEMHLHFGLLCFCYFSSSSPASSSAFFTVFKCVIYVCWVWPETGFDLRGIVIDVLAVGFAGPGAAVR